MTVVTEAEHKEYYSQWSSYGKKTKNKKPKRRRRQETEGKEICGEDNQSGLKRSFEVSTSSKCSMPYLTLTKYTVFSNRWQI